MTNANLISVKRNQEKLEENLKKFIDEKLSKITQEQTIEIKKFVAKMKGNFSRILSVQNIRFITRFVFFQGQLLRFGCPYYPIHNSICVFTRSKN